jgi:RnfABCDGE-type electron transport complex B subunit
MIILWAVLVMLGVSVFLGVMIAVFAKVFEVKVDPRVAKINEALPSVNCGACGYPGCAQYAEAIVEQGADTKLCKPGGPDTITAILEILKESKD